MGEVINLFNNCSNLYELAKAASDKAEELGATEGIIVLRTPGEDAAIAPIGDSIHTTGVLTFAMHYLMMECLANAEFAHDLDD